MRITAWPCAAPGGSGEESALVAGPSDATARVLIVPALFEEANRTRRMLTETMRLLAERGMASVMPDLPGCNESLAPLNRQDVETWRAAIAAAAVHFAGTHVLAIRGGALVAPALPGCLLEPIAGSQVLRPMLRARTIAARENGREETMAGLLESGRIKGIELAGYCLGAEMIHGLESAEVEHQDAFLSLHDIGGEALWLRNEPGENYTLSQLLAAQIIEFI